MTNILSRYNTIYRPSRSIGFISEYKTIYDTFTTKPSTPVANAQNTMVKSLVDSGVWAEIDVFYVLAGHINSNGESLINWKNPGTSNATAINSPLFTALEGFTGDGATAYINTNYNLTSDSLKYTQNSGSVGIYARNNVAESVYDFGVGSPNTTYGRLRQATDTVLFRINDGSNLSFANTDSRGMFIIKRTGALAREIFRNKISIGSDTAASLGLNNLDMFILSLNNAGSPITFSSKQISLFFMGSGGVSVDNITDTFETYMDSNGKGVI